MTNPHVCDPPAQCCAVLCCVVCESCFCERFSIINGQTVVNQKYPYSNDQIHEVLNEYCTAMVYCRFDF